MLPNKTGHFKNFGGKYVPETLMVALDELEREYLKAKRDPKFKRELDYYLKGFAGRPTPLYFARNLTKKLKGAKIYLKREDLLHTGAHKINNTLGQLLLARRMKKNRIKRRFMHKLYYDVRAHNRPSCVGCGRCVDMCFGGVDIIKFINMAGTGET